MRQSTYSTLLSPSINNPNYGTSEQLAVRAGEVKKASIRHCSPVLTPLYHYSSLLGSMTSDSFMSQTPSGWTDFELPPLTMPDTPEAPMTDQEAFVSGLTTVITEFARKGLLQGGAPTSIDAVQGVSPSSLMLSNNDPLQAQAHSELSHVSTPLLPFSFFLSTVTCPNALSPVSLPNFNYLIIIVNPGYSDQPS